MFELAVLPLCRAPEAKACIDLLLVFARVKPSIVTEPHKWEHGQEQCEHTLIKTDCVLCSNGRFAHNFEERLDPQSLWPG